MRWVLLVLCFLADASFAHRFAPSVLQIDQISDGRFSVAWKTPLEAAASLPPQPLFPQGCDNTSVSPWIIEGTGQRQQSILECQGATLAGQAIAVRGLAANQTSVLLTINLHDGVGHQAVLTAEEPSFTVPTEPDPMQVVGRYSILGVEHIWGGIDHLLFVLGLVLLVVGGRRLLITVTAFTVGHSITLAMVTLGWFTYPVALIEFLIALSIFVLALELSRPSGHSVLWRKPWWLAGGFGLLHGMGFAGALAETGLPQTQLPLALLFFNIGIELGQLAFIAVLMLIARALQGTRWQQMPVLAQMPVLVLGVMSAQWCIERGIEVLDQSAGF